MTNLLLTCAFLFLLWRLCAPGESVVAEMADMESGVEMQTRTRGSSETSAGRTGGRGGSCPFLVGDDLAGVAPRLSLPAISPELEHAAIRMVEEWR